MRASWKRPVLSDLKVASTAKSERGYCKICNEYFESVFEYEKHLILNPTHCPKDDTSDGYDAGFKFIS